MILRFNQHVCVLTTLGERRFFHRRCIPFAFRAVEPDDLAA